MPSFGEEQVGCGVEGKGKKEDELMNLLDGFRCVECGKIPSPHLYGKWCSIFKDNCPSSRGHKP